jgi:PadR family transcriptional regulator AphA
LCLGILAQQDASGYEIKKAVEEGLFAHFIDASYGSIYPALTQMLGDGHVSVREDNQPGKPPKKVYSITETGKDGVAQGAARHAETGQVQVRVPVPGAVQG